eukprot:gene46042-56360_t
MNRRPYLDKITSSTTTTPNHPGCTDFNSVTNFPSLKHCGIKSSFEPAELAVADPEGKLTMTFRVKAKRTMMPILRDENELNGREEVFKRGHKQYIDKILLDMENRKQDQIQRRMRHWTSSKSELGFSHAFNSMDFTSIKPEALGNNAAEDFYAEEFDSPPTTSPVNAVDLIQQSQQASPKAIASPKAPSPILNPPSPHSPQLHHASKAVAFPSAAPSTAGSLSSMFNPAKRKSIPYNRMKVFEELMRTTSPPKSSKGTKRFGSLVIPPPSLK